MDRIDEKIEEVVERKVEEKLEKKAQDEIEDSVIDRKIEEKIAEKVANRDKREKQNFVEKTQDKDISRRSFLKMLGVGAGGLALSSSAAGLTWSKITPSTQGTSDIKSSTVKDGAITSSKISSDAVTQAKIASGAVGTSELGFDTATQTELDNHVGDSTAHHTKPTGTTSNANKVVFNIASDSSGSVSVPETLYADKVTLTHTSGSSGNFDIFFFDANSQNFTINDGETVTVDNLNGNIVTGFDIQAGADPIGCDVEITGWIPSAHSHNLQ